jgi:hypothetical protein
MGTPACPTGFGVRTVVYTSIDDARRCSACGCTPMGVTCTPTVTLYEDGNCTPGMEVAGGPLTSCTISTTGATGSAQLTSVGTPAGGRCVLTGGGVLTGSAAPVGPYTVCCTS